MALQIDPLLLNALSGMVCVSIFSGDMTDAPKVGDADQGDAGPGQRS
jgi:hypothetical protein